MEVKTDSMFLWRIICCLIALSCGEASLWERWWSYEGINGPLYWGKANREWKLCKYGRQQSPINIQPSRLLYDPNLKHLKIDSPMVSGLIMNTGHDITLEVKTEGYNFINISQGPLSYNYRVAQIKFHLANNDRVGSEHQVAGKSFPVESEDVTSVLTPVWSLLKFIICNAS